MDEATSHLDVATEMKVSRHIADLGITRIIVAHRPQTISTADRVVKLDHGRSVELPSQVQSPAQSQWIQRLGQM
jgi:ATP-binding cassette subfamily B protein RaxB